MDDGKRRRSECIRMVDAMDDGAGWNGWNGLLEIGDDSCRSNRLPDHYRPTALPSIHSPLEILTRFSISQASSSNRRDSVDSKSSALSSYAYSQNQTDISP